LVLKIAIAAISFTPLVRYKSLVVWAAKEMPGSGSARGGVQHVFVTYLYEGSYECLAGLGAGGVEFDDFVTAWISGKMASQKTEVSGREVGENVRL